MKINLRFEDLILLYSRLGERGRRNLSSVDEVAREFIKGEKLLKKDKAILDSVKENKEEEE